MNTKASASKAGWVVAGLLASLTLVGGTAVAKPSRAKAKTARAPVSKVVKLRQAHIEPVKKARGRKGTPAVLGPGSVKPQEPGEVAFTLSANNPSEPYHGRLIGHYPREWRTGSTPSSPGGEIWLSQNQVPHGSYAVVQLNVEPGHEYQVTLCTTGGGEMVRATVGDTTHTFKSGDRECDVALVLQPEAKGMTNIKIDFAEEPRENGANAFAVLGVDVVRR